MLNLPSEYLLAISFVFSVTYYIANSLFAKKISSTGSDFYFYMFLYAMVSLVTIYFVSGGINGYSLYSVLLGIVFGLTFGAQTICSLKAVASGPFSYTTVIVSLSTIIPTLSGLFWGETISTMQIIGIVLMLICILLSTDNKGDADSKKASLKWLFLALSACILNGLVGVLQKIHQSSTHKEELPIFLITAIAVLMLLSLSIFIVRKIKNKNSPDTKISFRFKPFHIAVILSAGISIGTCHVVNLFLAGALPAAILFPIINICPLIITTIFGVVAFHERLSFKRWIGLAIGVVSMLFVGGIIA